MFDTPLKYSRPVRTFDGEGSVETLSGTPKVLYCDPSIGAKNLTLLIDLMTDVRIGDIIEIPTSLIARGETA